MKINWGVAVTVTYLVFATATTGFVVFAMSRPVSLVRPDYYAESLREDQHLAARRNADALSPAVTVRADEGDHIRVAVPAPHSAGVHGSLTLYRASDVAADRTFAFQPDDKGEQTFDVARLARGVWVVQLRWSVEQRDYYVEQPVVLK